jgi:hypothetical protein
LFRLPSIKVEEVEVVQQWQGLSAFHDQLDHVGYGPSDSVVALCWPIAITCVRGHADGGVPCQYASPVHTRSVLVNVIKRRRSMSAELCSVDIGPLLIADESCAG